jgi:hypothetical protein
MRTVRILNTEDKTILQPTYEMFNSSINQPSGIVIQ